MTSVVDVPLNPNKQTNALIEGPLGEVAVRPRPLRVDLPGGRSGEDKTAYFKRLQRVQQRQCSQLFMDITG